MENTAEASFQQFDLSMMPANTPIIFCISDVERMFSIFLTA